MPRSQPLKFKNGIALDPSSGKYHIRIVIRGNRVRRVVGSRTQAEAIIRGLKQNELGVDFDLTSTSRPKATEPKKGAVKAIPKDNEIAALYLALEDHKPYQRAVLLGLLTALRQSDVLELDSTDIDDGIIISRIGKDRERQIAIPVVPTLARALRGVEGSLTVPPSSFRTGMRGHTRKLPKAWSGIGKLRSTAAAWASDAGFTEKQVGVLLGHRGKTIARRRHIHSVMPLADPFIELRRAMLAAIEARLVTAIHGATR